VLEVTPAELLARANGSIEVPPPAGAAGVPSESRTPPEDSYEMDFLADTVVDDAPPPTAARGFASGTMSPGPSFSARIVGGSDRGSITTSGALAELRLLLPTLSPEDAEMVVSLARRLSTGEPQQRRTSSRSRSRGSTGRESRTEAYLRFWSMYLEALEQRGLDWGVGRRPEPRSYFTTPSPLRGASISASFARNRMLRHELYINRGSRTANLELLGELRSHREEIEAIYGHKLDFEDPGRDRRAVRIAEYREGHISRSDEFDDYIDWFIDRGVRMRRAIDAFVAQR
jgi:hypothetical protein